MAKADGSCRVGIKCGCLGFFFQSFEQADVSTTRKYGGSGLEDLLSVIAKWLPEQAQTATLETVRD